MTEPTCSEPIFFSSALDEAAKLTDAALERLLVAPPGLEARVYDAMRYSALAPGKRLRPFLVLAGAGLFGVARRCALQFRDFESRLIFESQCCFHGRADAVGR